MEYKIHIVYGEEKLSFIADKYNTTPEEIKALNPNMKTFGGFIGGLFVAHGQRIKIPDQERSLKAQNTENTETSVNPFINLNFEKQARYRCEQFNATKLEQNISFHSNTKKEYLLLKCIDEQDIIKVILNDYVYKINPQSYSHAIEATKELEYEKENVIFRLNENHTLNRVLNYHEIKNKWEHFKSKLIQSDFYKEIKKVSAKAAEDIIQGGNLEFGTEENLRKTYDKGLFYHTLFNDFDTKTVHVTPPVLQFMSQIFVNVPLELSLSHTIVKEDESIIQCRTVGTLQKDKLDRKVLEQQYDKFYKPVIQYGFTEYDYEYRIRRTIDKKTNLVSEAKVVFTETIKNNYQIITQFDLKQVEL